MPLTTLASGTRNRKSANYRWASNMASGKQGGAYGMRLFSDADGWYDNTDEEAIDAYHEAHGPGLLPYTFNPNLWCAELLPLLTGCVIFKDDCALTTDDHFWRYRYGGVAVTPRHVVGCSHAMSWAQGSTPGNNGNTGTTPPTRMRFIDANGATVDRAQIHQIRCDQGSHAGNLYGAIGPDMSVWLLDEDLPPTITPIGVPLTERRGQLDNYEMLRLSQEYHPESGELKATLLLPPPSVPADNRIYYKAKAAGPAGTGISITHVLSGSGTDVSVAVDAGAIVVTAGSACQNSTAVAAVNSSLAASALVTAMLAYFPPSPDGTVGAGNGETVQTYMPPSDYPVLNNSMFHIEAPGYVVPGFKYSHYRGDSGTPWFAVINGRPLLTSVTADYAAQYPHTGGPSTGRTWGGQINAAISAVDDSAKSAGIIAETTGYTVTEYPIP